MNPTTLTVRQLFLLCAFRNPRLVVAKNTEEYKWTFLHEQEFLEKMRQLPKTMNRDAYASDIRKQIEAQFETKKPGYRNFCIHNGDFVDLSDFDDDLSWFSPSMSEDWNYKGNFILEEELTHIEHSVLKMLTT